MEQNGCSLLIKNLSFHTSPEKIRKIFQSFGKVRDVYLPLDHYTRRPRGFGFVEYYEPQYAKEALTILNHSKIDGNEVNIIIAQNRRKSPETMKRYQQIARKGDRWSYKGHPPYRSESKGKIIHRRRDTSSEEEEEGRGKCYQSMSRYQSKSRIMHKMSKKEKRLKRKKVARRYCRSRKKYSESASTYSASSSYRSSYSRGSNRRSNRRRRPRRRSGSRRWKRDAVRSTSRTISYSTSYSASSYESDKGRRRTTKRKNPRRRQRKGEKEATTKVVKKQSSETFSRSVSLSNSEGERRDGGFVKDPQKGIERRSGKDPGKESREDTDRHTCKDMRGKICKSFSLSRNSHESNKDPQNCMHNRGSYSTEEENQPGEQTHHNHGESLKRDDRVETIKAKNKTKSSNNSSEDTTSHRDPDGESNSSNEVAPKLSYQGSPTNGQHKQPYLADRLEEREEEKKEKGTKKKAKSVSTSSSSDVNCGGVTHEEARDKTYAERESPPAKKVHRKSNSNNGSNSNREKGSSQGTEEESCSCTFGTKRKRTCLSTTASNTNSTQMMDHLQSGETENDNGVNTKNKSSSSTIEKENKFHLKEDLELRYLSGCDNAKGGNNFDSGEDRIGGNANSSSRTSSTYRRCRKKHKQRYLHGGKRKKRINESHSTDRSTTGDKKSIRTISKERKSGKTENAHRRMMKDGRRNRGRITLSKSESRDGSNGGGKINAGRETTAGVTNRVATGGDVTREGYGDSAGESLGSAKSRCGKVTSPAPVAN
ncbi:Uncharacterized protein PCOAH_00046050 [Plasmodium coatneyi]|uniref:RRM domain-containing protein n=1 Tax=Plasmodium coatneyi TaxID=208452 RepID=A0A1B1E376_9APIC|nr:Uncharacterized protein PCOAH_00046050 [Plasmodium coatneyi]ANQ09407.1 Uncharacterized protein PCOAH_00046050 [Plasmodium coatneyi]